MKKKPLYDSWASNGDDTHSATCQRGSCKHVETTNCGYTEVTVNDQIVNVCVVCCAMKDIITEMGKTAATAFPLLLGAKAEPLGNNAHPRGQLTVHGQQTPCDGVLYALTIAFEYPGRV